MVSSSLPSRHGRWSSKRGGATNGCYCASIARGRLRAGEARVLSRCSCSSMSPPRPFATSGSRTGWSFTKGSTPGGPHGLQHQQPGVDHHPHQRGVEGHQGDPARGKVGCLELKEPLWARSFQGADGPVLADAVEQASLFAGQAGLLLPKAPLHPRASDAQA